MMSAATAIEILRRLCAIWFLPHVAGKLMHYRKAAGTFEAVGLRPGLAFVGLTLVMETAAAIGLFFGVYLRGAGILAALVLLGAAYAVVRINGANWRWQLMGPEYPIFWAITCLVAAFSGAG